MSIRYCGTCGAGWGPDYNFCPRDGMALTVGEAAVEPELLSGAEPAVVGARRIPRKPIGTWSFGSRSEHAQAGPEVRIGEVASSAQVAPRAAGPAPLDWSVEASSSWSIEGPARRAEARRFDLPEPRVARVEEPRTPPPVVAPRGPRAPGRTREELRVSVEAADSRTERRPSRAPQGAPEVARALRVLSAEVRPSRPEGGPAAAEGPREAAPIAPRRDGAAFSETAWFRRPMETATVDEQTGRVAVTASTYRPDPNITPTQRRKFSLRRSGEDAV